MLTDFNDFWPTASLLHKFGQFVILFW